MSEYVLACGHRNYGGSERCASISCHNYYGKWIDEVSDANRVLRELFQSTGHALVTSEVHNGLREADKMSETEITQRVERARMTAEQFIELAGFDPGDSDRRGGPMDGAVLDLLTTAFLLIGPDECNEVLNS